MSGRPFPQLHRNAIKQGYLTKSPPLHKRKPAGWKRRWFILETYSDNRLSLSYYVNEDQSITRMPKDRLFLDRCTRIEVDLDHSSHKNVFSIHLPERVYYFSADSRYEMNQWADVLCSHLSFLQEDVPPECGVKRKTSLWLPVSLAKEPISRVSCTAPANLYGQNEYGTFGARSLPPTPPFGGDCPPSPPPHRSQTLPRNHSVVSGVKQSIPPLRPHHRPLPPTPPTSPRHRSHSDESDSLCRRLSDPSLNTSLSPPIPPRKHSASDMY